MFMGLNINKWKEYKVGELFEIIPTKGVNSEELLVGNDVPYIAAKKDDNGLKFMCQREGYEDWISKGNCIVFIQLGQGSAGYALYVSDDFIGMSGKTSCGYIDVMTPEIGLFLTTILSKERPKYSFGRSWTGERLKETIIKLPTLFENDKPLIDETKKYSKLGYIPDWDFMEQYIKSLDHKPLTTQNCQPQHPLNIDSWQEFCLRDIFEIKKGKRLTTDDQTEGNTPYIGAIDSNNGVANYIGQEAIHEGNTISINYNGSVGEAFYQPKPFWATDDVNVLYFKEENGYTFNKYIALFICAVLKQEKYRYSYGRKWVLENMRSTIIKLPAHQGKPDFNFMENYMKSLPYGDRI